jgi:hypothetical protein
MSTAATTIEPPTARVKTAKDADVDDDNDNDDEDDEDMIDDEELREYGELVADLGTFPVRHTRGEEHTIASTILMASCARHDWEMLDIAYGRNEDDGDDGLTPFCASLFVLVLLLVVAHCVRL